MCLIVWVGMKIEIKINGKHDFSLNCKNLKSLPKQVVIKLYNELISTNTAENVYREISKNTQVPYYMVKNYIYSYLRKED